MTLHKKQTKGIGRLAVNSTPIIIPGKDCRTPIIREKRYKGKQKGKDIVYTNTYELESQ